MSLRYAICLFVFSLLLSPAVRSAPSPFRLSSEVGEGKVAAKGADQKDSVDVSCYTVTPEHFGKTGRVSLRSESLTAEAIVSGSVHVFFRPEGQLRVFAAEGTSAGAVAGTKAAGPLPRGWKKGEMALWGQAQRSLFPAGARDVPGRTPATLAATPALRPTNCVEAGGGATGATVAIVVVPSTKVEAEGLEQKNSEPEDSNSRSFVTEDLENGGAAGGKEPGVARASGSGLLYWKDFLKQIRAQGSEEK